MFILLARQIKTELSVNIEQRWYKIEQKDKNGIPYNAMLKKAMESVQLTIIILHEIKKIEIM